MIDFTSNLKKYRKEKGFTQAQLAEKLGTSQNAIHNWESGKREPNFTTLDELAIILDVSVKDLLGLK